MKQSLVLIAGLAAVTILALHVSPAVTQERVGTSPYVSQLLLGSVEMAEQSLAPFRLVQGKHYNEYTLMPPKAPDYREYYGFGLPAYPPYGSAGGSKSYFPYDGRYPSYGDSLYKYRACPPWATYPYEC